MRIDEAASANAQEAEVNDLGPLAWVLDELRKSLDAANKSLKRYVRDTEAARGTDLASVDASQLRMARQQLHQAVGALEMVGFAGPAQMLRAMESAVQQFVQRPEKCNDTSASVLERASFALVEYLELFLGGTRQSAVGLFPQYRDAQLLAASERIHPADLWEVEWRWLQPAREREEGPQASVQLPERTLVDQAVLRVMQKGDAEAAALMRDVSLGVSHSVAQGAARIFWAIGAAFFEAIAHALLPVDLYVKRAASQVLLHYASFARGDQQVSERLARDLLFFCAQSVPPGDSDQVPALIAVRQAYRLTAHEVVDYETRRYGRFDPALLIQARKRIEAAKETWSALAGGNATLLKGVVDQFGLVAESIVRLHPQSQRLADGLRHAAEMTARSGTPPAAELALEVATSVLYLEAALADRNLDEEELGERTNRLAERLDHVCAGGHAEPLESWMEDLYRRVSDRQTMGTVVGELRVTLAEAEKALDQFFRQPEEKDVLNAVPTLFSQMRGVLSVLGLDEASRAVVHMRECVERIVSADADEEKASLAGTFDKLGNNLGALGLLMDMLNYQPALAKKLFIFDSSLGELRPLMGRAAPEHGTAELTLPIPPVTSGPVPASAQPGGAPADGGASSGEELQKPSVAMPEWSVDLQMPAEMPEAVRALDLEEAGALPDLTVGPVEPELPVELARVEAPTEAARDDAEVEEDDLQAIFLEEAREVIQNGLIAVEALGGDPRDTEQLTVLRRAFHTLKGSSRMVGLMVFGEAAWALEQVLNLWLADHKPASHELCQLAGQSLQAFSQWVEDVEQARAEPWTAQAFQVAAEALRRDNVFLPIQVPGEPTVDVEPVAEAAVVAAEVEALRPIQTTEPSAPKEVDLDLPRQAQPVPVTEAIAAIAEATELQDIGQEAVEFIEMGGHALLGLATEVEEPPGQASLQPAEALEPEVAAADEVTEEEQVKVIGDLRIGIPLYNVFLNEADEWSRRLTTLLNEWTLELDRGVPPEAEALAHSLAGSSATVGFSALSEMARALEHALQHMHDQRGGTAVQARVFSAAAEDIRRLLHQFAAGFLKEPDPAIVAELRALEFGVVAATPETPAATPWEEAVSMPEDSGFTGLGSEPVEAGGRSVAEPAMQSLPLSAEVSQAVQALPVMLPDGTDDLDMADVLDPDLFPIFEEEAGELLPRLGSALRQWATHPDQDSARGEVLRALHTLKGSARLAGAMQLGELAHRLESEIEGLGTAPVQGGDIAPLLARLDAIEGRFETLRAVNLQSEPVEAVRIEAAVPIVAEAIEDQGVMAPAPGLPAAPAEPVKVMPAIAMPAPMMIAPVRAAANQAVRVRSQLLDRLVNQAGEVMVTRSRLEAEMNQLRGSLKDLTDNLDRLRLQLRDIELQAESQMQSRMAQAKEIQQNFDPLEFDRFTRVQELTRMMAESVNDVATVQRSIQRTVEATEEDLVAQARQTRALQQDLLRTRMVEFEGVSERLYRVVRQASKETGKQVKLDIHGGSIEMDRGVLDRMTGAFEHLLRNCVVHGIEDEADRVAAGKESVGSITIDLQQAGNDVSVTFADDGAGLDVPRIRERAVQQGLITADQSLSDEEAANLIFMSGFTTASKVTELAGRGIGMDVVRAEVQSLGGRIETHTQLGAGTSFKLVLPLTTAVTQVVVMRSGALSVGVPANLVELVRRVTPAELAQAYSQGSMQFGGEAVPFFWSGALLQASSRSDEPAARTMPVVIFRSANQRVAIHVDEILGNQEAVVKNLGPQLSRLPGLAGLTVLASGAVILIYNPVALASIYGEQARQMSALPAAQSAVGAGDERRKPVSAGTTVPLVLIVDDSITVRRVTQRLLQREGYRVALAADGLQALERLQDERPALVLSDIEMPRMDGFDLARNIRSDPGLKGLPIVMITSRIAEKHREHAQALGVNHYLGKPYSEEELLSLVRRYAEAPVPA